MTKRFTPVIIGFLLLLASLGICASNIKIEHWQTKAGAKVYFVKTPTLPMFDVRVVFAAGSAYDGAHWGLAAFVTNFLGQATTHKTANDIADEFDDVGAEFDTDINRDMSVISLRTLSATGYSEPALATFSDVLAHAVFNQESYQLILNQTLANIKLANQAPDKVAEQTFNKALYGDQPYGHPVLGTAQTVSTLTLAQIKQFYQQYYVAQNADIILVGDLSRSRAQDIAQALSSALPEGAHAKDLPMMHALSHNKTIQVNFPSKQTAIIFGQLGITRKNPDYFPLMVGNSILGQLPLSSLLFQNVRNTRGLAYSAVSNFDLLRYKGPFEIQLKTRVAKANESVDVVKQTVSAFIKDGPTADELTMAKNYINGSFVLSTATNSAILQAVTNIAFYNRPLDFLDTYLKNVNDLTDKQIKNAFAKTLKLNQMILVTVGPKA